MAECGSHSAGILYDCLFSLFINCGLFLTERFLHSFIMLYVF